ncbi:MAG: hypothetical protein JW881_12025 [Spirochaetales bacterium]|nr:hypothetical protein [Spirochaetales bacterium]
MAEGLALMGTRSKSLINCTEQKPEAVAVLTIREIFDKAGWKRWASLNDLLPILAEASPVEFLTAVEQALQQNECPFDELFAQEGKGLLGSNYLSGLWWALEALSWDEEYITRTCVILGELASHDPGGNWANRPINSLTSILLPWHPQTKANSDTRIAAFKAVLLEFPGIAWKLVINLLPEQHQTSSSTYKPQWRNPIPGDWKPKVTNKEYQDQVEKYADIAVYMAVTDPSRIKDLVENLDNLPESSFDRILRHISSKQVTSLPENERLPIWISLKQCARKHRRYADTQWALDAVSVSKIEAAAKKIAPESPEGRYRELFINRSNYLYESNSDIQEQNDKLNEKRQKAVQEIMDKDGINGIIAFTHTVESAEQVGWALGAIANDEIDTYLLPEFLTDKTEKIKRFISMYILNRYCIYRWEWVDGLNRSHWTMDHNCQFLMCLPFVIDTWHRVTKWLNEDENQYWKKVNVNPYDSDDDLVFAIDKLIEAGRPQKAIDCLCYRKYKKLPLDRDRTMKALFNAISSEESSAYIDSLNAIELIKELQNDPEADPNDLFKIEWAYLPLLDSHHDAEPKFLEKQLASNPGFFCELIQLVFKSSKEEKNDININEGSKNIAENTWRLLHNWKRPPGMNENGNFESKYFKSWLEIVKEKCRESGHYEVAMRKIGEVLVYCPADKEGLWIDKDIARMLNEKDADPMRRGFNTEVYNSRGFHAVDPKGKQEREIAGKWREKAYAVDNEGFARFAASLRELAGSFEREARMFKNIFIDEFGLVTGEEDTD